MLLIFVWIVYFIFYFFQDSGVHELVEPVVWYYQHNVLQRIPPTVWETYGKLFPGVWVASAFKGATGSAQILTNASVHLDNNLQWVNVVRSFGIQAKKVTFRGVILTGWQRYDHFATLCELLPVGLPSLALSLQAMLVGGFGPRELTKASHSLNCSDALDLQFPALVDKGAKVSQDCSFPGSAIFYSVQQLWGIMEVYKQDLGLQERISGWMTDYQYRQGISSPGQMKVLAHKLTKVGVNLRYGGLIGHLSSVWGRNSNAGQYMPTFQPDSFLLALRFDLSGLVHLTLTYVLDLCWGSQIQCSDIYEPVLAKLNMIINSVLSCTVWN